MKKNSGFQKLLVLLLLGVITIGNVIPYRHFIQKGKLYEVGVQVQKKATGRDVGKAD